MKSFISGAAPQNPLALPLETPWRCPLKPLRRKKTKTIHKVNSKLHTVKEYFEERTFLLHKAAWCQGFYAG